MKSTVSTKVKASFPVLMQSLKHGYVVMFIGDQEGVVVYDENNVHSIGYHSNEWVEWNNMCNWKKFEGTITLENE